MSENQQKQKPVVGVYALTSCYGCQLQVATVSRIVEVAQAVNFGSYYMLSSDSSMHSKVDVAFVEGSVSTEKDLLELKEIRKNAKILVAMGACAVNGGVQSWDNGRKSYQELYSEVYGEGSVDRKSVV